MAGPAQAAGVQGAAGARPGHGRPPPQRWLRACRRLEQQAAHLLVRVANALHRGFQAAAVRGNGACSCRPADQEQQDHPGGQGFVWHSSGAALLGPSCCSAQECSTPGSAFLRLLDHADIVGFNTDGVCRRRRGTRKSLLGGLSGFARGTDCARVQPGALLLIASQGDKK